MFVPGLGTFVKPTCAQPTVTPDAQGAFSASIDTGGADAEATGITVLAIPQQTTFQCQNVNEQPGVPAFLEDVAAAKLVIDRPNPNQREIIFAGETWLVKSASVQQGPHGNWFSASPENVFVDGAGRLHLRITNRGGRWYCAEIISKRPIGYGQFSITVDSSPIYDRNIVFGAYTYADTDPLKPELDLLEIGARSTAST